MYCPLLALAALLIPLSRDRPLESPRPLTPSHGPVAPSAIQPPAIPLRSLRHRPTGRRSCTRSRAACASWRCSGPQEVQPNDPKEVERLRKQVELLQKQIEVLQKMAALLAEQAEKADVTDGHARGPVRAGGAARPRPWPTLSTTTASRPTHDADRPVPALDLKELFNPHRNNESPLGIYGTLSSPFVKFQDRPSNFPTTVFSPHFYLLLNERVLMEVNPEVESDGTTDLESAQLDWFLHDNLTLVVGRFYSPLGFFNERLHTTWIFKTPDRPLMFSQVFPSPLSMNGVQLRGAVELGGWPVKLEYSGVVTNGFSMTAAQPNAVDFANLNAMSDAFNDVNGDKALGGRVGLSFPAAGLIVGLSGLLNGAYDPAGRFDLDVAVVDVGWHRGNWDFRSEFARTNQEVPGGTIRRRGFYTQIAYRPYDCGHPVLERLEGVIRFDSVRFGGIDPAVAALSFGGRELSPIGRNRYTVGLNYYPYPSLILKAAYALNDEVQFRDRRDHGFLAQVAWGF